jgi:E3 ubiquitin-protein ligase TRIP12
LANGCDRTATRTLLEDLEVSSFVAGLLNSGDSAITNAALQLAQLLMAKLPDVFRVHFVKEGVVHVIDKLAASAPAKVSQTWT